MPVFVVFVVLVLSVAVGTDPQYSATRSVVLVRTGVTELRLDDLEDPELVETPRNPYEAFNSSNEATAEVMAEVATSRDFRRAVGARGVRNDYLVQLDDAAPIIVIEATGPTEQDVLGTTTAVVFLLNADLQQRQSQFDIPVDRHVIADDVVEPTSARVVNNTRDRALIGVVMVGMVLVVVSAIIAEAIANWRRRRADEKTEIDEEPQPDDDTVTEHGEKENGKKKSRSRSRRDTDRAHS